MSNIKKYMETILNRMDWRHYALILITGLGAGLRLYGRGWGLPLLLHPDEWQIVDGAMYMIREHTFLPPEEIFQWPGHLMMYMSLVLYKLYAAVKLRMPVELVYEQNPAVLYLLSRYVSIFFGTVSIILIFLIMEKIRKNSGVIAALITAVFPVYVVHSAYASADIPLLCVMLAAVLCGVCYLEKASLKNLLLMCFFTGLAVTVKYSAAALCLGIALVVTMESLRQKSWKLFFGHGLLAAAAFALFTFLCSPALLIKYKTVITFLFWQADHEHLGIAPQGFRENLMFYIRSFLENAGSEYLVFLLLGGVVLLKERKRQSAAGIGFLLMYWVCLSSLSFCWVRWGIPIYAAFIMIGSVGLTEIARLCKGWMKDSPAKKAASVCLAGFSAVVLLSMASLTAVELFCQVLDDSQQVAVRYCQEHQITRENAVSDGVDSLDTEGVALFDQFVIRDGRLVVKGEYRNRKYLVMNSNVWGRYFSSPDRYGWEIELYNHIFDEFELVREYIPIRKGESPTALGGLAENIRYAMEISRLGYTGGGIRIFRIPEDCYTDFIESASLKNMSGMEEGETVFDTKGSEGYVVCGPYTEMLPGSYLAKVTIRLKEDFQEVTGEEHCTIDVCRDGGTQVYGVKEYTAKELEGQGAVTVELPFTLTENAPGFEFRIYETENMQLLVSDLSIAILE